MSAALLFDPRVLVVSVAFRYGERLYRPECEVSKMIAEWLKQKTLTVADIEAIKQIGFEVRVKGERL